MAPNYRALVANGFFSSDPFDKTVPVSIRCNNAGAINGAAWEKTYPGYVDTVETTPGNKTTIFEAPEYGVAVWWELMRRYRARGYKTFEQIINAYGGGQDYSSYLKFVVNKTGLPADTVLPLADDTVLLPFAKAMFHYEAGRATPLHDAQIVYGFAIGRNGGELPTGTDAPEVNPALTPAGAPSPLLTLVDLAPARPGLESVDGVRALQKILLDLGYLDPPVDGGFGPVTKWALRECLSTVGFAYAGEVTDEVMNALSSAKPLPLDPGGDLAGKIVRAMQRNGYWINRHPQCTNIVYVEGMNADGTKNANRHNAFDDVRIVFRIDRNGKPEILGAWDATTEPGKHWTDHPMNSGGAFHIKLGQYKAWIHGYYHTHEVLVQAGELHGFRDPGKTYSRDYSHPVSGEFGIHQHWGYDYPKGDLKDSSAGCLVGRSKAGHVEFMNIVLADARHVANPNYRFMTAILSAADVLG